MTANSGLRGLSALFIAYSLLSLTATVADAQPSGSAFGSPVLLMLMLAALSLAPFLVIMLTSFVKVSVVLSIIRNAIGTQQIPPTQVITGFSFVLTIFIMTPVVKDSFREANFSRYGSDRMISETTVREIFDGVDRGKEPIRQFLLRHAHVSDKNEFFKLARDLDPNHQADAESFTVAVPAFVTSELKEAFFIGFMVYLPFLIIDMVVSNILMALGMMMLSPTTVSLPFKLLLFVITDGWLLVVKGLVIDYVVR